MTHRNWQHHERIPTSDQKHQPRTAKARTTCKCDKASAGHKITQSKPKQLLCKTNPEMTNQPPNTTKNATNHTESQLEPKPDLNPNRKTVTKPHPKMQHATTNTNQQTANGNRNKETANNESATEPNNERPQATHTNMPTYNAHRRIRSHYTKTHSNYT